MMLKRLSHFFIATLRGRLIMSVAAVHAVMMTLFIAELTLRQSAMLLDRQNEEATALSLTLATSAAGWIAADDISGLQELVEAQHRYPELIFAILADDQGRVLAATDKSRLGQYLLDLPRETRQTTLSRAPGLVDVATPAMLGGHHVGWARIGIGQKAASEKLGTITRNGIIYTLAAIVLGSAFAWFMGKRITRRLYVIQETIAEVRSGNRVTRSIITGDDEAAVMAREFNSLLDALSERDAKLHASEERNRSLIEKVQTAILLHDSQGNILTSNPMAHELLGLSEEELLGKSLMDPRWHFLQEDGTVLPVAKFPVSLVLSTGEPLRGYVMGIRRPGEKAVAWVLANAEPEYDDGGALSLVILSFVDITERKQAEEQLRRIGRELSEAQRIAHLGNWNLDLTQNLLTWSDEIYRIFEIDPEYFGASYEAFLNAIHPDDREMVNNAYTESVRNRIPYDIVHRLRMEDGRIKYVNERCETYYAEDGSPLRSVGTVHDITERRLVEEKIRKLNEELEQRVAERTSQLAAANKELEAFAYSVSHDLRAPLRHIDGYVDLLVSRYRDNLNEKGMHYVDTIAGSARQMGVLIDDLLQFSRTGRAEMRREAINMNQLLREALEPLKESATGRAIEWSIGELPSVRGDYALLRQVWANLLGNAIKYTRQKEIARIEVTGRENNGEIIFAVSDNGVGFDMQYSGKLFGVFQRLHSQEQFEGTGIGLATVQRIVNRHGGRVWAEAELNRGATFFFALPTQEETDG